MATQGAVDSGVQALLISYDAPRIDVVDGTGTQGGNTWGGEPFALRGASLGPQLERIPAPMRLLRVSYGPYDDAASFEGIECRVASAHTVVTCLTARGVGSNLRYRLISAGQSSLLLPSSARYAAPAVFKYDDEGAVDAPTEGSSRVVLSGESFGFETRFIEKVRYSSLDEGELGSDGAEAAAFFAWGCNITAPDRELTCYTQEGAGGGLKWSVWAGRQKSVQPTTSYARPQVDSIDGPGSSGASTAGSQLVILRGADFGPPLPVGAPAPPQISTDTSTSHGNFSW